MQRMPRSATGPEILLRRELHRRGLRFRVNHPHLPGRPDIAFTGARVAVFIDGCFWHACPQHGVMPKNNREWWPDKLTRNVERDREKDEQLDKLGGSRCTYGSTKIRSRQRTSLRSCGGIGANRRRAGPQ